ncbi:MAG: VanZ family protein, partial [Muribaculaceae bacterium]
TGVIIYLTLFPHPLPGNDIRWWEHSDKLVHGLMFGGFVGAFTYDSIRNNGMQLLPVRKVLIIGVVAMLFGGAIEVIQEMMKIGRTGDLYDLLADFVGILLFSLVSQWIVKHWFIPRS